MDIDVEIVEKEESAAANIKLRRDRGHDISREDRKGLLTVFEKKQKTHCDASF